MENTPIKHKEKVRLSMHFRLATPDDLKVNDKTLRYGQIFALKNSENNDFKGGFSVINANTNPSNLLTWLHNKMIYVPVDHLDYSLKLEH